MKKFLLALIIVASTAHAQVTYNGNGNTGFGGTVGNGSLVVNDNGTDISLSWTAGNNFNDIFVIYINSVPNAGFASTATFNDQLDGGRKAVSGVGADGRSTLTFPSNFGADYALAWGSFGAALFQLNAGGNGSLAFIDFNSSTTSRTIAKSSIGITGAVQFQMVASYTAENGVRSNEALVEPLGNTNIGTSPVTFSSILGYPVITLNASIGQFGASWQGTQAANVNWQVNCSSGSVSMVVERSSDGRNFAPIHSETATAQRCGAPFYFTDKNVPAEGAYYRLAMQNNNGRVHYSKVALLKRNGSSGNRMMLAPTMAQTEIWLQTNLIQPEVLNIRMLNAQGKVLQHLQQKTAVGSQNLRLAVDQLPAGIYFVQVQGSKAAQSQMLRFVKQ